MQTNGCRTFTDVEPYCRLFARLPAPIVIVPEERVKERDHLLDVRREKEGEVVSSSMNTQKLILGAGAEV